MGVSKNRATPKWMVIKMDDLGVPLFSETSRFIFHMFSMSSSLPKTSPVFLFDLLESYCKATKNQSEVTPLSKITYILYSDYPLEA